MALDRALERPGRPTRVSRRSVLEFSPMTLLPRRVTARRTRTKPSHLRVTSAACFAGRAQGAHTEGDENGSRII